MKTRKVLFALALIISLFLTNILNAWSNQYGAGIAVNNIGGIDNAGLFLCNGGRVSGTYYENPLADLFPALVVDC